EELEVARTEMELAHRVNKPAEAERYRMETLAAAERIRIQTVAAAEAEAARLRGLAEAEVLRARGEAEAEALRMRRLAEADGLRGQVAAGAEGMNKKAEAWKRSGSAAVAELFITKLPEIATAVTSPLAKIDRITMVNSGREAGTGLDTLVRGVTDALGH